MGASNGEGKPEERHDTLETIDQKHYTVIEYNGKSAVDTINPIMMTTTTPVEAEDMPSLWEKLIAAQADDAYCKLVKADPNSHTGPHAPFFYDEKGVLYHRFHHAGSAMVLDQLVVPEIYAEKLVRSIHYSPIVGHLGIAKTMAMVQKLGYWMPKLSTVVRKVVSHCHGCQRSKAHKNIIEFL